MVKSATLQTMNYLCLAVVFLLVGCKHTTVTHRWPDQSVTEIRDTRLFHKQEAQVSYEIGTNGTKKISAGVRSAPDKDAIEAAIKVGVEATMRSMGL